MNPVTAEDKGNNRNKINKHKNRKKGNIKKGKKQKVYKGI